VIKVLGVVKGLLIFFFSIFTWLLGIGLAAQTNPSLGAGAGVFGFLFVIIGIVVGVLSGTILFILGILISALGQNLLAMLDVAVHTSPFLTTEEKSQALS
jgi:type III secretory pathway component EscT